MTFWDSKLAVINEEPTALQDMWLLPQQWKLETFIATTNSYSHATTEYSHTRPI